jgi:DNA-binding transcriptional regulator YhcF (GntR family)
VSRAARDRPWTLPVTPAQKLVITALAERTDDEGHCFPSLTHLTRMTGLARSTIAVALQELEAGVGVRSVQKVPVTRLYGIN